MSISGEDKLILYFNYEFRLIKTCFSKCSQKGQVHAANESLQREKTSLNEADKKLLNEQVVLESISIQKNKEEFEDTIEEEYLEKSIMFGFIVVIFYYRFQIFEYYIFSHFCWAPYPPVIKMFFRTLLK